MRMSTPSAAVPSHSRWRTRAEEIAREQTRSARAWTRALTPGALPRPPEFLHGLPIPLDRTIQNGVSAT